MPYTAPSIGLPFGIQSAGMQVGSTVSLNAAATWAAYSFLAEDTMLAGFYLCTDARVGTDSNISIQFELQADLAGNPSNIALETVVKTGGWPTAANSHTYIAVSWPTNLMVGVRYWIVAKNVSSGAGSPSTDNIPIRHVGFLNQFVGQGSDVASCIWAKRQTADSGVSWATTSVTSVTALSLKYTSGKMAGGWYNAVSTSANGLAERIYPNNDVGTEFYLPVGINLLVVGAQQSFRRSGSPGNAVVDIYRDRALLGSSYEVPMAGISTSGASPIVAFPAPVLIQGGAYVAIMGRNLAGSSGTNYYYHNNVYRTSDTPDMLSMKPFNGTVRQAIKAAGAWSFVDTAVPVVALHLDAKTPFPPSPINRRNSIFSRY